MGQQSAQASKFKCIQAIPVFVRYNMKLAKVVDGDPVWLDAGPLKRSNQLKNKQRYCTDGHHFSWWNQASVYKLISQHHRVYWARLVWSPVLLSLRPHYTLFDELCSSLYHFFYFFRCHYLPFFISCYSQWKLGVIWGIVGWTTDKTWFASEWFPAEDLHHSNTRCETLFFFFSAAIYLIWKCFNTKFGNTTIKERKTLSCLVPGSVFAYQRILPLATIAALMRTLLAHSML